MTDNPNDPNISTTKSKEYLLTKEAIRKGIWQAIKTKTNYNLALDVNSNKTGGIFTDSVWLKDNYNLNPNTQDVIGKLISENSISGYINADLYNLASENKTSNIITLTEEQENYLGIKNGTILNRLPIADAELILSKLIYEDAKLLSQYNKLIDSEIINDFKKQKLMLSGYDIIISPNTTIPTSATSTIYTYDNDEQTALYYEINVNDKTFTISNTNYTYYPNTILIKIINPQQKYTISNNEITAINGISLTKNIPIDFEYVPEYIFEKITKSD